MNAIAKPMGQELERVLIGGDLSRLSPDDRVMYYKAVCESVGLNPLTKPLEYITLNNKLTLYALANAAQQLRAKHGISVTIKSREVVEGCYVVTALAHDPDGRQDESLAAVPIDNLKGDARCNAMMKCETKAKRRVTLSICGLGMLDETEVDTIPGARIGSVGTITPTTGALASLPIQAQETIIETAQQIKGAIANDQLSDAYALWSTANGFDADEQVALQSLLDSKVRGVMTRMAAEERAHAEGKISPQAKTRLEARIKELGLDRDRVKSHMKGLYGKEHFSDLTREEYEGLDELISEGPIPSNLKEPAPPQAAPPAEAIPPHASGADLMKGGDAHDADSKAAHHVTGAAHPSNAESPHARLTEALGFASKTLNERFKGRLITSKCKTVGELTNAQAEAALTWLQARVDEESAQEAK